MAAAKYGHFPLIILFFIHLSNPDSPSSAPIQAAGLCCDKFDFDPRPGCFGDLFQGFERKSLVLSTFNPRNRLLAGAHAFSQLLLFEGLPLFFVMSFKHRIFEILIQPASECPHFAFFHFVPPVILRVIQVTSTCIFIIYIMFDVLPKILGQTHNRHGPANRTTNRAQAMNTLGYIITLCVIML